MNIKMKVMSISDTWPKEKNIIEKECFIRKEK